MNQAQPDHYAASEHWQLLKSSHMYVFFFFLKLGEKLSVEFAISDLSKTFIKELLRFGLSEDQHPAILLQSCHKFKQKHHGGKNPAW